MGGLKSPLIVLKTFNGCIVFDSSIIDLKQHYVFCDGVSLARS